MKVSIPVFIVILMLFCGACIDSNPNKATEQHILEENKVPIDSTGFDYPIIKEVYVPVYSDIYSETRDTRFLLTATLSIRNTSKQDSIYIKNVDYYDTEGTMVRRYLETPVFLKPLETMDYVIEREDNTGGSGANFLITWGAYKKTNPIFQGVMVGIFGQHGIAFTTDGITISEKKQIIQ